jgi:hypothetical protein
MTPLDELKGWLDVYRAAHAEKSRAEAVMAQAREKIEDALGDDEVGTVDGEPVVRWTFVRSTRFDQKRAKAILGEEYDACLVPTESRRFSLVTGDEK